MKVQNEFQVQSTRIIDFDCSLCFISARPAITFFAFTTFD